MSRRTHRKRNFSEQLRRAIGGCGLTRYQLSKRTGISEATLSRFMSGQRGLTLKAVDKLADLLEWKLESKGRRRPPGFMDAPRAKVRAKRATTAIPVKEPTPTRPRATAKARRST
ncbi:MAG TPA: helix-turn-helix transcriptional regulator [Pirellulales bacterium]|nr:helix-turn-helix transcriptional regulator [Pirellulales bacterium]